jgi:hypothetical protein
VILGAVCSAASSITTRLWRAAMPTGGCMSMQHGYIRVYPYYELLQSSGSCSSCTESHRGITNLNTASLMSAYSQNFAL